MTKYKVLFGSNRPFGDKFFTAVDDRVRGGSSKSFLEAGFGGRWCNFHGKLDFTALGGAGFASQKTYFINGEPSAQSFEKSIQNNQIGIDLSKYDGLCINVLKGDGKTYSINLKDQVGEVVDPETGKRASRIEYKYLFTPKENLNNELAELGGDFSDSLSLTPLYVPFYEFVPYYRGRPVASEGDRDKSIDPSMYAPLSITATPINLKNLSSLSIMCSSSFGKQSGFFSLVLESISAYSTSNRL